MYKSNLRYITFVSNSFFMYFAEDGMYYHIYFDDSHPYFIVEGVKNYVSAEEEEELFFSLFYRSREE